jgi:hypothetical protein
LPAQEFSLWQHKVLVNSAINGDKTPHDGFQVQQRSVEFPRRGVRATSSAAQLVRKSAIGQTRNGSSDAVRRPDQNSPMT